MYFQACSSSALSDELLRALFGGRFCDDADDGLGVGRAKVHPSICEIDAHTIGRIAPFMRESELDLLERCADGTASTDGREIEFRLDHRVLRHASNDA